MSALLRDRANQVQQQMSAVGIHALVVTHLPNVLYLSGFTGSSAALLIWSDGLHLFTDGRYTIQARQEVLTARVHITRLPPVEALGVFLNSHRRKLRVRAGFESAHLNVAEWIRLKSACGSWIRWKPITALVERIREIKSPEELDVMRHSAKLASEAFTEILPLIKPGVTELDLAAEIDFRMRRKGAAGPSFDTIVASGPRSALPHAHPTEKPLRKKELVVFDLGAILRHYCSDLTRTVFLGRAPSRIRHWYQVVEQAQQAALETLRAGIAAGEIDAAARRVLNRQGLGGYFVHGTGHGLGIEIHESPRVGRRQKQEIRAGNVITLEPGVYVQGVGGIRIEDEVAVHPGSTEVLTSAPRGLLEL